MSRNDATPDAQKGTLMHMHIFAAILAAAVFSISPSSASGAQVQVGSGFAQFVATLPQGVVRGEALRQLVTGSTMSSTSIHDNRFELTFLPDFRVKGRSLTFGGNVGDNGEGVWRLEADEVCIDITWGMGRPVTVCRTITRKGDGFVEGAYGHKATFTR